MSILVRTWPASDFCRLDETTPRKRIFLKYRLPSNDSYESFVPIFQQFVRVSDLLAQSAHFRPEVLRKIKAVRDAAIKQIQKAEEEEKAEERNLEREKEKKAEERRKQLALEKKREAEKQKVAVGVPATPASGNTPDSALKPATRPMEFDDDDLDVPDFLK